MLFTVDLSSLEIWVQLFCINIETNDELESMVITYYIPNSNKLINIHNVIPRI